jgi:hypothetical protein
MRAVQKSVTGKAVRITGLNSTGHALAEMMGIKLDTLPADQELASRRGAVRATAADLRPSQRPVHKTRLSWPVNAPLPQKPATGPAAPVRRDAVEVALGLAKGELTSYGRNVSTGVTSTRLYALRGPIQFRPYLLDRKGYKAALQIKVDAGMLVIVGKAKTKAVPAHWRVELHCGKDITVLHTGFNAHGHPANKDAAIGNAYSFLVK